MATPRSRIYFTEEEYLAIERASEERHEYIDGRIFAKNLAEDYHSGGAGKITGGKMRDGEESGRTKRAPVTAGSRNRPSTC